jgi:hypothetical protein
MANTANYSWVKPTVGGSADTWGAELNTLFDNIDTQVKANETSATGNLPLTGGTLTGAINGTDASFTGTIAGDVTGAVTGNADTATAWAAGRTIELTGVVTGTSGAFDGSANLSFATAIADGALAIAKTSGLQASLDAKLPLAGGTVTGDIVRSGQGQHLYHNTSSFTGGGIYVSTSDPSGGANGDIWLKYTA